MRLAGSGRETIRSPWPSSSPKAGSGARRGPRAEGGGLPPLPRGTLALVFPAAPLYPRQPAGGPGRHRAQAGEPGVGGRGGPRRIRAAAMVGREAGVGEAAGGGGRGAEKGRRALRPVGG